MRLNAAEWARVESLFPQAAELAATERTRFLDRECASAPRVRAEIEAMLAADSRPLLDAPVSLSSSAEKMAERLEAGTRLGSWRIKSLIGHGGMGEVYLAERADGAYRMNAAIKLLKRELFSYANAQRFLRERRVLARLSHPNIARVLDAGTTDDGRPYLVMEYVHGARITEHAQARNLAPRDATRLMLAVAEAVADAHRHGVVHRDLKPANVMVTDAQQVKLLDFGIAKLMDEDDAANAGILPMTPAYAAPEQILGQPLTPAADVYALGVMLFQLLARRLPHRREGLPLPVVAAGLRDESPLRPSQAVLESNGAFPDAERRRQARAVAGDLDWIVLKALRAEPGRRYADAAEFAEDLRRYLEQAPVAARPGSLGERARQSVRRALASLAPPPAPVGAGGDLKYWAFISYSHQDEAWARWLHAAIETYRVPRRLVGRPLGDETVPRRLFPVFRDRDELPSSHELGAVINQALRQSRNLVVVCSPRAATSRWVNEEIRAFRALGRGNRVFCLIVDGEPHASAQPAIAFSECFPPALREPGFEPIAADARARKDGKAASKLKLLAGLLDVGLDELKQRENQRRLRARLLAAAASLAIVGALVGSWQWFAAQREAREREIRIEKLVENGRQELLAAHNARAAVYLNEALKLGHDTVPLRYMLARAMEPVDALLPVRFRHGGTVLRAAFSPDGTKVAMAVRVKDDVVGKVFDAASGAQLRELRGMPKFPRIMAFFGDGEKVYASGFEKVDDVNGYFESEPATAVWTGASAAPALRIVGNAGRNGAALHPDGSRFLVATPSSGIGIWDANRGAQVAVLGAGLAITAASFDAQGKRVISADEDGNVEVRDVASGRVTSRLRGAEGLRAVVALFFPDGKQALVASSTGDVRIWNLADARLRLAFVADPLTIIDARLNRDGRRLLTIGPDGYKVWSTSRGLLAHSINRSLKENATGALTGDGNFLFTADGESAVTEAWGVLSKTLLYTLEKHTQSVDCVALDAADERILTASRDGDAELWSTRSRPAWGREFLTFGTYAVRFADAGLLVAGGTPEAAHVARISGPDSPVSFEGHSSQVFDASASADGKYLLTGGGDGTARWWDARAGKELLVLRHGKSPLHLARLSRDGTRAVTASGYFEADAPTGERPRAVLWDLASGQPVSELAHAALVYEAAVDFSDDAVATGDMSGQIKLWNLRDGSLRLALQGPGGGVRSVAFSKDGLRLVSASEDHVVSVWNAASGALEYRLEDAAVGAPYHARFNPAADEVAIATEVGTVWLWRPADRSLRALKGHTAAVHWLRFLADGQLLLSTGADGSVRLWDVQRGAELGKAAANRLVVLSHDVSRDEQRLATASRERYVALWNIGLESRPPAQVAARLACRAPWRTTDDALEARATAPDCRE